MFVDVTRKTKPKDGDGFPAWAAPRGRVHDDVGRTGM